MGLVCIGICTITLIFVDQSDKPIKPLVRYTTDTPLSLDLAD